METLAILAMTAAIAGWRADYAELKHELEQSYSHLAWVASPASGVDLPALDRSTRLALDAARSDADANAAIASFIAGFHDGHLAIVVTPEEVSAATEPPQRASDTDARAACAAFGYGPVTRVAFSLPFESLNGFKLQSDGISSAFRSGTVSVGEHRIGLVRIPRFRATEYPTVCIETWSALHASGSVPTADAVQDAINAEWLRELADRLASLRAERVEAVVVDVGGNGGGNDLGEWAARLFTSHEVHSARLFMHTGPLGAKYMDEQLEALNQAHAAHAGDVAIEPALVHAIEDFERRKRESLQPSCDLSWVWREQRRFDPAKCSGLVDAGSASGALDYLAPGSAPDAAAALYWASAADPMRGAWDGPVYLVTDAGTASAAEMFAALMKDNGIAKTVGSDARFGLRLDAGNQAADAAAFAVVDSYSELRASARRRHGRSRRHRARFPSAACSKRKSASARGARAYCDWRGLAPSSRKRMSPPRIKATNEPPVKAAPGPVACDSGWLINQP